MKKIIIINGTGGCGKDTFIQYVSAYIKVTNFSSVDIVKKIASYAGWIGGKTEKDRKFLSDLKRLMTEYNDMPFKTIKEAIDEFNQANNLSEILFIHIREPEEIKRVVDSFNALTLLIKKPDIDIITSNYSDANIENYKYDFMIINTTLKNLDSQAKRFVEQLQLESNIKN